MVGVPLLLCLLSVCLSTHISRISTLHKIFCTYYHWPWLSPLFLCMMSCLWTVAIWPHFGEYSFPILMKIELGGWVGLDDWSDRQTHPFISLFSRTTWVSRHKKGHTNLDFNKARDDGVAVESAGPYAIICTLLQTDNHASTSSLNFYRPDAVPDTQPAVSKHWKRPGYIPVNSCPSGAWHRVA